MTGLDFFYLFFFYENLKNIINNLIILKWKVQRDDKNSLQLLEKIITPESVFYFQCKRKKTHYSWPSFENEGLYEFIWDYVYIYVYINIYAQKKTVY